MRLSFANGEHADFVLDDGVLTLGNANGNTLVLPALDVAPWHARVSVDARGIVLEVLDPNARTHVNARPVRERALLRQGDVLCLGRVQIALKPDRNELISTDIPRRPVPAQGTSAQPGQAILRGVSGSHFGKTIAVGSQVIIGSAAECDLVIDAARIAPRHAAIEHADHAIWLRNIDAADGSLVNGVRVRNAVLHPGDQVVFEGSHFVVEAPGFPMRGERVGADGAALEQGDAATGQDSSIESTSGLGAIWWLLGAAALIALAIAFVIYRGV